jgi:hypothetical protein
MNYCILALASSDAWADFDRVMWNVCKAGGFLSRLEYQRGVRKLVDSSSAWFPEFLLGHGDVMAWLANLV